MKITALAGGVGGAKLVKGLAQHLHPTELSVVVNTGDDFEHFGLYICPDLDTICYTLAGISNPETYWGRRDDTWNALQELKNLGAPTWFRIGDKDLATHLERTRRMMSGEKLSEITRSFCTGWGIEFPIFPMSDDKVSTHIITENDSDLPFQEYFVKKHFQPRVKSFRFVGIDNARPCPGIVEKIESSDAVIICPSNPWVSIDPILSVKGLLSIINQKPCIAVSPIINGDAVKGPAAKMFKELGVLPSAISIAQHYLDKIDALVIDSSDVGLSAQIESLGIRSFSTDIMMRSGLDQSRLAHDVLDFTEEILTRQ